MTTSERRRIWAVGWASSDQALCVAFCTVWIWDGTMSPQQTYDNCQIQSVTVVGAAGSRFCSLALLAGLPLGLGTDHSRCDTLQANSTASCISRVLSSTAVSTGAQPETDCVQAGDDWQV
ncbi:hypothetical protein J3E68DRAFT_408698 [Trichoderma sp. SZMC 28012]